MAAIDWDETRERLADIQWRLEQTWTPSPEEQLKILQTRAAVLARQVETPADAGDLLLVVEFVVAGESYAIESSLIREVSPLGELTPLPGAPPFVLGITNLRGAILSVIDIKKFFDLPEKGITNLNRVIVVRHGDMEAGILADAVSGVKYLGAGDIQPPLPTHVGIRADYLKGITAERVAVLDARRILDDPRIIVAHGE